MGKDKIRYDRLDNASAPVTPIREVMVPLLSSGSAGKVEGDVILKTHV